MKSAVNRIDVNSMHSDHTHYGAYSQQDNARFTVPDQHRYTDQSTTTNINDVCQTRYSVCEKTN